MAKSLKRHGLTLLAVVMFVGGYAADAEAISGVTFTPGGSVTQTGTFNVEIGGGGYVVECPITLSGSFATTLVTIGEGAPTVGSRTGLTSGSCARGSIVSVLSLPRTLRLTSPTRTAPAGNVERLEYSGSVGIRVRLSTGEECLFSAAGLDLQSVEAMENNEYTLGPESIETLSICGVRTIFNIVALNAPVPRQVATFLTGNEVIDGFTPRPVAFGTVRVGELTQRTVTIGSAAGGRVEEIVVTAQRYFAITDPNGCRGRTLAASGTCNINVLLSAPTESGRTVTDTLTVRIGERRFEGTLRAST